MKSSGYPHAVFPFTTHIKILPLPGTTQGIVTALVSGPDRAVSSLSRVVYGVKEGLGLWFFLAHSQPLNTGLEEGDFGQVSGQKCDSGMNFWKLNPCGTHCCFLGSCAHFLTCHNLMFKKKDNNPKTIR